MSRSIPAPEILDTGVGSGRWVVVIFDNDVTPLDEVIEILMISTGCGVQEASIETWEAQHYGHASVHFGDMDECEIVAHMISSIGVRTQVVREWTE